MPRLRLLAPLICLTMTACAAANPAATGFASAPSPLGSGLSSLVGNSSDTNAALANLLNQPAQVTFPARVGVVFYSYADPLQPEDSSALLTSLSSDLQASGLVQSSLVIPASLVTAGSSVDEIRTLAARFHVDVALIISGSNKVQLAQSQPQNWFSNAAAYESRSTLSCLTLGVLSGTFLAPLSGVAKAGPATIDPTDPNAQAQEYQLVKQAQTDAMKSLTTQFIGSLTSLKAQEAAATPTPAPSAMPSADASASASPAASTSPSASPSAAK